MRAAFDLVHYSEGIPSAMHCGYNVLVKLLLCRHYLMFKGLSFVGVSQGLGVSQTGYENVQDENLIKMSWHVIEVCESVIKERRIPSAMHCRYFVFVNILLCR